MDKNQELFYKVWLSNLFFIKANKLKKLINNFQGIENLYKEKSNSISLKTYLDDSLIEKFIMTRKPDKIKRQIEIMNMNNANVISIFDDKYPKRLKEIYNPPMVLFYKGNLIFNQGPAVAIVGSRKCSSYGKKIAYELAKLYSELGILIVSGLASGIDAEAHKACVENNGLTIAVLGSGISNIYPKENENLSKQICKNGLIISEFPPDTTPLPFYFPIRNRIISGLSTDIIVVEAREKSGALITADFGLDQGKNIYAVPGNIDSKMSNGTNLLIKDGATALVAPQTLIEESDHIRQFVLKKLGITKIKNKKFMEEIQNRLIISNSANVALEDDFQMTIYNLLSKPKSVFEIAQELNKKVILVQNVLSRMEIYGVVKKDFSNTYFRNLQ